MNTYSSATFVSYRNERCYSPEVSKVLKALILGIFTLGLESCHVPRYAKGVHPRGELALVGYKFSNGAQSARAFFVREISMRSHVMAELERDTFECAGNRLSLSTNPFRLRHPHLVVNGEAPLKSSGAH
jgi:hypothetical protein